MQWANDITSMKALMKPFIRREPRALRFAWTAATLLLTNGCALVGHHETDKVISMQELPAAVRPLAEKEVVGCRIIEVEKENKNGKVIYAIAYHRAGVEKEIEYVEDGALLYKGKE